MLKKGLIASAFASLLLISCGLETMKNKQAVFTEQQAKTVLSEQQNSSADVKADEFLSKLASLADELRAKMDKDYADLLERIKKVEDELKALKEYVVAEITALKAKDEQLEQKLASLEEYTKEQVKNLETKLEEMGISLSDLKLDMIQRFSDSEEKLIEIINTKEKELRAEIARLDAEIDAIKKDIADLKVADAVLTGVINTNHAQILGEIKTLQAVDAAHKESLETGLSNLQSALTEAKTTIENKMKEKESELRTLINNEVTRAITSAQESISDLEAAMEENDADILGKLTAGLTQIGTELNATKDSLQSNIANLDSNLGKLGQELSELSADHEQHKLKVASDVAKLTEDIRLANERISAVEAAAQQNAAAIAALQAMSDKVKIMEEVLVAMFGDLSDPNVGKEFLAKLMDRVSSLETNTKTMMADLTALKVELYGEDGNGGIIATINSRLASLEFTTEALAEVTVEEVNTLSEIVKEYGKAIVEAYRPMQDCDEIKDGKERSDRMNANLCLANAKNPAALQGVLEKILRSSFKFQTIAVTYRSRLDRAFATLDVRPKAQAVAPIYKDVSNLYGQFKQDEIVYKNDIESKLSLVTKFMEQMKEMISDVQKIAEAAQKNANALEDALSAYVKQNNASMDELRAEIKALESELKHEMAQLRSEVTKKADGLMAIMGLPSNSLTEDLNSVMNSEASIASHRRAIKALVPSISDELLDSIVLKVAELLANYAEHKQAMVTSADQRETDGWNENFKTLFYKDDNFVSKCEVTKEATFANAIGEDALYFIIAEYQHSILVTDLLDKKVSKEKILHRILSYMIYNEVGPAQGDFCLGQVQSWASQALYDVKMYRDGISLKEKFGKDNEVLASEAAFTLMASDTTKIGDDSKGVLNWKRFDSEYVGSDDIRNQLAIELVELATIVAKKMLVEKSIVGQFNSVKGLAANLKVQTDTNTENIAGNQQKIDVLKAQIDKLMAELADARNNVNNYVVSEDRFNRLEGGLQSIASILIRTLDRLGYADLREEAERTAIEDLGFDPATFNSAFFTVAPHIQQVQHFYAEGYNIANTEITGSNGHWETWNKSRFDNMTSTACSDNFVTAETHAWPKSSCWVNFRATSLDRKKNEIMAKVVFRVVGSADVIEVKRLDDDSFAKAFNTDATKEKANANYIASKYAAGKPIVESNEIVASKIGDDKFIKVNGSPYMGAFDIYSPEAIIPKTIVANFTHSVRFIPVRARLNTVAAGQNLADFGYQFTEGAPVDYKIQMYSPLVLDFINVGMVQTLNQFADIKFDMDGDGRKEATGWVGGNRGGFLAIDLNNNHKIDNGRELFGQASLLSNGLVAENGYQALGQYDENQDGVIDQKDSVFSKLLIWFDLNRNGETETGELETLADRSVEKILVGYSLVEGSDKFQNGNLIKFQSKFFGPKHCPSTGCNSYDVFFGTTFELQAGR